MSKFKLLLIIGLLLTLGTTVSAENWQYPWSCCGSQDCHAVPCDELLEGTYGDFLWNGFRFLKEQVHPSGNGLCHVCIQGIKPMCAFIQLGF